MKRIVTVAALLAVALGVSGCGMHSSNMREGNQQSLMSLSDQRDAALTVKEYIAVPHGAVSLGPVDAARCDRYSNQTAPTREMVLSDLKIAAYAKGATGITDLSIIRKSGLTSNCWHILDGKATALAVPAS